MTDGLIEFQSGTGADHRGRRLADIQAWDFDQLEQTHDYIQWLFSLRQPSPVNPAAPVLTPEDIAAFHSSPELQASLLASLECMLRFYGFTQRGTRAQPQVSLAPRFGERAAHWMTPGNHNHLRITRILACLRTLGLAPHAEALFGALQEVYRGEMQARVHAISERSFAFWGAAAGRDRSC